MLENTATETTLLTLSASDEDLGLSVTIANFILVQPNVSGSDNFKLVQKENTAILSSIHPLDRSKQDRYILEVVAVDGGVPSLSSTATVTVIIDAVINNPPVFANNSATVTVPRWTPLNTVLYTAIATEANAGVIGEMSVAFVYIYAPELN